MNTDRFKPLFSLLLIFVAAPLLAALVTPWVYEAIQKQSPEVMEWVNECEASEKNLFFADLADSVFTAPFRRVNDRIALLFVLILLVPAYRISGMKGIENFGLIKTTFPKPVWRDKNTSLIIAIPVHVYRWGLYLLSYFFCDAFRRRQLTAGLVVAAISMLVVYTAGLLAGVYGMAEIKSGVIGDLLAIIIGVALIGLIEEILFRGYILNALNKSLGFVPAVLLGSALFAAVHFMKPAEPEVLDRWYSGLLLFGNLFAGVESTFWPEVCTLFCMGVVLSVLSLWTRSVYIAIGLHAGWVWVMMLFRLFTENQGNHLWLYGPGEWISKGWVGSMMALAVLTTVLLTRKTWIRMGKR